MAKGKIDWEKSSKVRSIRLTQGQYDYLSAEVAALDDRTMSWLLQRIVEAYVGSGHVRQVVKDYFKK